MRVILPAVVVMILLASCSQDLRQEFNASVEKYNQMMRWNDFETASLFTERSLRSDFLARTKQSDVRIYDFHVADVRYDEKKLKASVDVVVSYYLLSTSKAKTVNITEEWAYLEENGQKGWRLTAPLPELK